MAEFSKYIGLDVHEERISVAVAGQGREKPHYWGEVRNQPGEVRSCWRG